MNDKLDTLQNALRDLFVALGGNIDNVRDEQDVNDLIRAIGTLQLGGGGGSELPEVTAEDNGDVLTVVSGEWAKAAPSGGGVLVLTNTNGTLDKTWQEIHDAPFALVRIPTPDGQGYYDQFKTGAELYEGEYDLYFCDISNVEQFRVLMYVADSADGYPTRESGGGGGN